MRPAVAAVVLLLASLPAFTAEPLTTWPAAGRESKPWTRWWWLGSAVDEASLTRELESFAAAGLGGVEITPIYGVRGAEARHVDFLSPRWMQLLAHTGREARRLGLGVDMATGTGWPFGGPWVTATTSAQKLILQDGRLAGEPTGMQVKRAAPGGAGPVIDPFSPAALAHYLAPFGTAFADFPRDLIRGQFHDSFEYYGASWTPAVAERFQAMHGYDVNAHAAAELLDQKPMEPTQLARLKADYRATLAQLHLEFLQTWSQWSRERGWLIRNQSHGAPANLLDLYATADIPETEIFGSTPFPIPGLRRIVAELRNDQDIPDSLMIRTASSAAHVAGHRLVSSETLTWLREHWKEAPSMMKPEIDRLFVEGINHIVYHGTAFSPADATWPGWLFYASTEFNPRNPLWPDLAELNRYVARIQSVLQAGEPDNDILLYWPVHDVWDDPGKIINQLGVHDVAWLTKSATGSIARALMNGGYTFDYLSDAQLQAAQPMAPGLATSGGTRYRTLVVPSTRRMPVETLAQIVALARTGVAIHLQTLPEDVPGLGRLEERRARFAALREELTQLAKDKRYAVYLGSFDADGAPRPAVLAAQVRREPIADTGVSFIRRRLPGKQHDDTAYFFANLTGQPLDRWVPLGTAARSATLLDPLSGRTGQAALRQEGDGTSVYLQLAPGESFLLRTSSREVETGQPWLYRGPLASVSPVPLAGPWQLEFVVGGPALPTATTLERLHSWTELADPETQRFAGTARYRIDPLSGRTGTTPLRHDGDIASVYLQLAPGETIILRTSPRDNATGTPWIYRTPLADVAPVTLAGPWQVEFTTGGPALPAAVTLDQLRSWTELADPETQRFAGTARYRLEFDLDRTAPDWWLDLGDVRETARVRLNGHDAGTAWSIPFRLPVGEFLRPGRNVIEIEVTNLAANRIRDLDRRGVDWKIMHEINYVNILYRPFDASAWDLAPSGLLGPVRLVPATGATPR